MKKANEDHKGQSKATGLTKTKFDVFSALLGSFGVIYWLNRIFSSFKAEKAKKAALVAFFTNLQTQNFVEPNILSYDPEELFKSHFDQNRAGSCRTTLLNAKIGLEGQKIE